MTIEIKIRNVTSEIHGVNSSHEHALEFGLSYFDTGAVFTRAYQRGTWDGRKYLYKIASARANYGKFPSGLISRVVKIINDQFPNEPIAYQDLREKPLQQHPLLLPGVELFDYQQEAVNKAIEVERGLFRAPTGSGKSVIEAAIVARLNLPTLVMSHRLEILEHLKTIIEKSLGFEVGLIQGSNKKVQRFNVAMIQTIASCYKRRLFDKNAARVVKFIEEECQLLIVDEAHHSSSASYEEFTNRAYRAYYRMGWSATPSIGEDTDMLAEAAFGRLQFSMTPSDLIKQKRLSKPYIFFFDYGDDSQDNPVVTQCNDCGNRQLIPIAGPGGKEIRPNDGDDESSLMPNALRMVSYKCRPCDKEWTTYMDSTVRCIVRNDKRNHAIATLAAERIRKGMSVLVLVQYIEHGREITDRIKKLVDPTLVQFVYSETENKKMYLDQLGIKQKMCLVATSVFGEGIDLPSLNALIIAKSSASPIDIVQSVGRALRRSSGKWKTVICDFVDRSKHFRKRSTFRKKLLAQEPEYIIKTIKRNFEDEYNTIGVSK